MRLINAKTLELEEFQDSDLPQYAILSHTWEKEEMLFDDMNMQERPPKLGYRKIQFACKQARKESLSHVWVDTCCIDKRSSAELQECINSMFRYYSKARICYAYLSDVPDECASLGNQSLAAYARDWNKVYFCGQIRWFTRGWTLQELIGPSNVQFFSMGWHLLGTKSGLSDAISDITGIPSSILDHRTSLSAISVAQKMSWASQRRTTRVEDQAYSLLGLFGVNMPMLYGEGSKAFIRLQEEIIKMSTDHSIFAWDVVSDRELQGDLLAASPYNFSSCGKIVQWGQPQSFAMTNRGLQIWLQTKTPSEHDMERLAVLNCRYNDDFSGTLALRLQRYKDSNDHHVKCKEASVAKKGPSFTSRLAIIPVADEVLSQKPRLLQVTRVFKPQMAKMRIWIGSLDVSFKITEVYPNWLWDSGKRSMIPEARLQVRGGATIETLRGEKYHVVFGWDQASAQAELDENNPKGVVNGVWISPPTSLYATQTLQEAVRRSYDYCIHLPDCFENGCACVPSLLTAYRTGQRDCISACVRLQKIMDELVLVVTISSLTMSEGDSYTDYLMPITELGGGFFKQQSSTDAIPETLRTSLVPCDLFNTPSLRAYFRQVIMDEFRLTYESAEDVSRSHVWLLFPSFFRIKSPLNQDTRQILPCLLWSAGNRRTSVGPLRLLTPNANEIEISVVSPYATLPYWTLSVLFHIKPPENPKDRGRNPSSDRVASAISRTGHGLIPRYVRLSVFLPVENMILTVNCRELSGTAKACSTVLLEIDVGDPGIGSIYSKKVFEDMASKIRPKDLVPFEKYIEEINTRLHKGSRLKDPADGDRRRPLSFNNVAQNLKMKSSKSSG